MTEADYRFRQIRWALLMGLIGFGLTVMVVGAAGTVVTAPFRKIRG